MKFHSLGLKAKQAFAELHKELFAPLDLSHAAPDRNMDKRALRDSYRNRLWELGLLEPVYKKPESGKVPEFDLKTGRIKAMDHKVTGLGKLLLRYVDPDPIRRHETLGADKRRV